MSFPYSSKENIRSKTLVSNTRPTTSGSSAWVRNPSWLALPGITSSDNKFIGLHRIDLDSNFLALSAAGNYTVDWGDGSPAENYNANVVAYKQYSFSSAGLSGTNAPVTLTDAGDLITRTSHGYTSNSPVSFYNIVNTTGLTEGQIYYVINPTTDTFQVSSTVGGTAISLTTDGTATLLPYKQAIVTVTPQAGATFTAINLHQKHNQTGLALYESGFLDIAIAGSSLTSILIAVATAGSQTQNVSFRALEKANILSSNITNAAYLFFNCGNLKQLENLSSNNLNLTNNLFDTCRTLTSVPLFNTAAVTNMSGMFTSCNSLTSVPLFNTVSVTNMSNMFGNCFSLTTVPLFNTASVTNMSSMFANCFSLTTVPLFNTVSVTTMNSMFNSCQSLETIPLFNTAFVTDMGSMFNDCRFLRTVPLFNTASVTNMSSMFNNCTSLTTVPLFNTAAVTNMSNMFAICYALETLPLFNTAAVTNMSGMFNSCRSLKTVPLFNTASVTNMTNMFNDSRSLKTVPLLNTASVTNMNSMFNNCFALSDVPLFNTAAVTNMQSMFNSCTSLMTIPLFNTASVTVMQNIFNTCQSLQTVPLFNTVAVTNMANMFNGCLSLQTVPLFNTAAVTDTTSMFNTCRALYKATLNGTTRAISYSGCKLSETELTSIINNLGTANSQGLILTISNNWGATTPVSLSGTTTTGSTTITMANTTGITLGMQVTGVGTPATTAVACTFTDTGDLVNETAHGLSDGDEVSFATITTTTGIIINKIYYVVNATADTFQVALTSGGSAIALTNNGSGTLRYRATVTAITPNTDITISRPATSSGTNTLAFRTLNTQTALLKGWAVTG